jgi:hypothetical protein
MDENGQWNGMVKELVEKVHASCEILLALELALEYYYLKV